MAKSRAKKRILVADDQIGTVELMTIMLAYSGFDVVAATDGAQALELARETVPDLALLDVMMPAMDGRDVCRRMKEDPMLAAVPVVLHSSADEGDVQWRQAGAVGFLQKPFSIRELPALVERYLAPWDNG